MKKQKTKKTKQNKTKNNKVIVIRKTTLKQIFKTAAVVYIVSTINIKTALNNSRPCIKSTRLEAVYK